MHTHAFQRLIDLYGAPLISPWLISQTLALDQPQSSVPMWLNFVMLMLMLPCGLGCIAQDHAMEHLTCFAAGWLALGSKHQTDPGRARRHMKLAEDIAETCWQMYAQQPTGIAPERVKQMKMDLTATDTREYILRPEAMESFWYMHQLTGDPKYREWGWTIFQSFEKHLKTTHGACNAVQADAPTE
jgi:hypothetical protein